MESAAGRQVLLVTAYWRTNLTLRQLAPLFSISKSTAGRVINHLGPLLALQPRKRFAKDTVGFDHFLRQRLLTSFDGIVRSRASQIVTSFEGTC